MIPLHSYLLYCGLYAVAIAVPGPGVIAIVARALGSGFKSVIPGTLGILAGDLVLMTLSAFGLALVAQAMGHLFLVVKIAGGLYLVWLGYKYWTMAVPETAEVVPAGPGDLRRGFLAYFALTLGNPKAITFFVALLPLAINPRELSVLGYVQLCCATFVLIPAITLGYAALAAQLSRFVASRKARSRINKGAGAVMACAGAAVMVS
ncbi:MAG: lysine transporter LysE [Alphaproteobacteria bacterium]|nr:lysine transporter LysE [Alphaproteobacteria bacterium]MDB5739280.1 lysine transporter LysE [Alphaproteobacteria bacterium]